MFGTYDKPDHRNLLDQTKQGIIGEPLDRPEGPLKVSGAATYSAEYRLENCAEGVLVTATIACGKVLNIHRDAVLAMPGVLAVLDGKSLLRRPAQGTSGTAPLQGPATVEYYGQPVALVVAETFEQATAAAHALVIDYSDTSDTAEFDPDKADEPFEKPMVVGDLDQAMKTAAVTVDQVYRTEGHASAAMEPHASMASWDGDRLTVRGSFQMLAFNVKELADAMGLSAKKVRLLAPYVGGGFGSKLGITHDAVAASLAAMELGRPVRVTLTRQQVFQTITRRSETRQRVRLAADTGGRLTGLGHDGFVSNLPNEKFAEPVTQATAFLYDGANRHLSVEIGRVARLTAGSVRAPGEAVGMQVLETAMDELAEAVGLDPVALRKRNLPFEVPGKGTPYSSRKLVEALDARAKAFGWDKRKPKPCHTREGEWWIGMGMASAARVNMMIPAKATVTLRPDGSVEILTDQTDIGTGSYAILGQIAGEMLGVPVARIDVRLGDSDFPPGAGSGGSFGATSTGSAVFRACEAIRATLTGRAGISEGDLSIKDGQIEGKGSVIDLLDGKEISETGSIKPGKTSLSYAQASYGAFFVEVAVNAYTGETRVRRMLGAFGIGRVLNAKTARSQCLGGMVWGIGSALTEALSFDLRNGRLVNHDLGEYHVPVNRDVPALEVILLDERDAAASPLQAKGVGELGICGAAGAIGNAIYNACGVRARSFPITLDKLLPHLPEP